MSINYGDKTALGQLVLNIKSKLSAVALSGNASDVSYTNTSSGLTSTTVQGAIDELGVGLDEIDELVG